MDDNNIDFESGRYNHELKNELRKNRYETKRSLNLKMLKPVGTINGFIVRQDNNLCREYFYMIRKMLCLRIHSASVLLLFHQLKVNIYSIRNSIFQTLFSIFITYVK